LVDKVKAGVLVASVGLGIVSWVSQTFGLLPPQICNGLSLVGAVLGVLFIGRAIRTLLGGVFGIDLLATVAIIASIVLGRTAIVVVLCSAAARFSRNISAGAPTSDRGAR
jgi:hypothetical protein